MLQRSRLLPSAAGVLLLEVAPHALALLDLESVKQDILSLWAEFRGRSDILELQFRVPSDSAGYSNANRNGAPSSPGRRHPLPTKEEIFKDLAVCFISDRFGGRVTEIKPRK